MTSHELIQVAYEMMRLSNQYLMLGTRPRDQLTKIENRLWAQLMWHGIDADQLPYTSVERAQKLYEIACAKMLEAHEMMLLEDDVNQLED